MLLRPHKWRNKYVIPGGHIEFGETLVDAVKREIKEVTGLEIYNIEFLGYLDFIENEARIINRHCVFLDFFCQTKSDHVELNSEAEEFLWVSKDELTKLPVEEYTTRAIEKYYGEVDDLYVIGEETR